MGEIKSTLDLVMEKTRNLTLSAEEKQEQRKIEIGSRIKGMIQKLQDGLLTKNQLIAEYESYKQTANLSDNSLLVTEIITRLDPEQNYRILLETLEDACRADTTKIRAVIDDYQIAYAQAAEKQTLMLKEGLAQKHFITGSAVMPNLDADPAWQRKTQDMRKEFEDELRQAAGKLACD